MSEVFPLEAQLASESAAATSEEGTKILRRGERRRTRSRVEGVASVMGIVICMPSV